MTFPLAVQLTIGVLLSIKWNKVVDYIPASIVLVRFASCLIMFKLIENPDLKNVTDKKLTQDAILMVLIPLQVCCSTNSRVDFVFTMPFGILFNTIVMHLSMADTAENMDCFKQPVLHKNDSITKWTVVCICFFYA